MARETSETTSNWVSSELPGNSAPTTGSVTESNLSPETRDQPLVGGHGARLSGPAVDCPNQLPIALHAPVAERREPVGQLGAVRGVITATGRRTEVADQFTHDPRALR